MHRVCGTLFFINTGHIVYKYIYFLGKKQGFFEKISNLMALASG
jgi:hypothetical protein